MNNINKRQSEIYYLLKEHGSMLVKDIIPRFPVSAATIRKDLTALQDAGMLIRTHGEVQLAQQTNPVTPYEARIGLNTEAKEAIERRAVEEIHDGDSIILDSGTTTIEIAKLLTDRVNLTVITNSLPIAMTFSTSQVSVTLVGGIFLGRNLSVQGPDAEEYLRKIVVDKTFISSPGIRSQYGLVTSHPLEASIKRRMIESGRTIYAVLDSSKLARTSVHPFVSFSEIDYLITERPVEDPALRQTLAEEDVKILLPD